MKLLKKITSLFLAFFIIATPCINAAALTDEETTSPAVLLMEAESGKILYEKNSNEVRACASITKVMTLLLVFEAIEEGKISMTDTVTASAHAASMGGSDIWLEEGESMTVDEMIKATVVASANDAAVALAEYICGTEEEFVNNMNKKAKELNMNQTTFKNCNGLDEEGHLTSAKDVALMSQALIKHKKIFDYSGIWMDNLREGKTQIVNTNKLLKSYEGITGLKTGTTNEAGSCITATATRDGLTLIAVVLGSSTGTERFKDASTLLNYGFANYTVFTPKFEGEIPQINVIGGMYSVVTGKTDLKGSMLIEKGDSEKITHEIKMKKELTAPVNIGDEIGTVVFKSGSKEMARYPVLAQENIEEINFKAVFNILLKCFVNL